VPCNGRRGEAPNLAFFMMLIAIQPSLFCQMDN